MAIASPNNTVSKARQALFDRGFKAKCERVAATVRKELNLNDYDPIDPVLLAHKQGAEIWDIREVPGLSEEALQHLTSADGDEWSAITVVCDTAEIIVINPNHSRGRAASDICHELSHLILGHESSDVYMSDDGFMLRDFNDKQEAEADWLAGALLLPRKALERIKYNYLSAEAVTEQYGVSEQLYEYRCRMTAVNRQFKR